MSQLLTRVTFIAWLCTMLNVSAQAQSHFQSCAENNPEDNATVIVPASVLADLAGESLAEDDEIAIFTPDGICSGVGVWDGTSLAISVQGDNSLTEAKDGFTSGEEIAFRVWNVSKQAVLGKGNKPLKVTYDSSSPFYSSNGVYNNGSLYVLTGIGVASQATASEEELGLPATFALEQNYPNPFNPSTTIAFGLESPQHVRLAIYNALGQEVALLLDGVQPQGRHQAVFNAHHLPSGLYFYQLKAEQGTFTKQMLMVK